MKQYYVIAFLFFLLSFSFAQHTEPTPTSERLSAKEKRDALKTNSLVKNIPFKSIGPTVMSGRVVDIEGDPNNPQHFYVAYASGGLWESKTNGITFEPLFDNQAVMTIGDIAVDWKHGNTLWVGTGENNSSRSSYSGTGIYKSSNNGKTWQHMGLAESHHIGRIIIHPQNSDIIWVAALGHLYSPNQERGIYKTTDGGKSWIQVLFTDENSGAVDLIIDPSNPDILYAAMWERSRRAWDFTESGALSGIYKSINSGENWHLISNKKSGFPTGEGVGRIGLAISPSQPKTIYALLDNQFHRPKEKEHTLTKNMLRKMSPEQFSKLKNDDINDYLDRYHFPMQFNADTLIQLIRNKTIKPQTLVEYLDDANAQLFDTPVIGAELYRSDDGGGTWNRTHSEYLDKMYYTFGYYFGNVRVSPDNADKVYLLGVPLVVSKDGGKTFISINSENVHVDHHALWIHPGQPGQLIAGNDGGINISADDGKTWHKSNPVPVGQFYTVAVDLAKPFNVYGGLQDNGVWVGPSTHSEDRAWQSSGHYAYKSVMGGDGMQIAVDTRDNQIIYTGYQFGNYYQINQGTNKTTYITPKHHLGERPLRFNWQTPIHLSIHNQDILFMGSHKLHRSLNQGKDWQVISGDLTKGGKRGNVPYGTLTSIHESPLQFGLIYTGSDDGLVHLSKDGGHSWQRISDQLPQDYWVSRVQASAFDTATVYLSLNGYRWDNCLALVYVSKDFGTHWEQIGTDLPSESVNVIKEDPVNPDILYVGTDHSLYISLDKGKSFTAFDMGLSDAPVHDLVVHPRDNKIVVATHGRSLYLADVSHLQKLNEELLNQALHIFPTAKIKHSKNWGARDYSWNFSKAPEQNIVFYAKQKGQSTISLLTESGKRLWKKSQQSDAGMNLFFYDLTLSQKTYKTLVKSLKKKERPEKIEPADDRNFYLLPGKYTLQIEHLGERKSREFVIKAPKKKSRKKQKKTP